MKYLHINSPGVKYDPLPGGHKFYMGLYGQNFRILPVCSHEVKGYQILHVALCSGPLPRVPKLLPWSLNFGENFIKNDDKFKVVIYLMAKGVPMFKIMYMAVQNGSFVDTNQGRCRDGNGRVVTSVQNYSRL